MRASDYGNSNKTFIVNTHLGEFINFNDTVLCYDLNQTTLQEIEDFDNAHKYALPDVILVKKTFPKVRRRQKARIWKLNRMNMEHQDENNIWGGKKSGNKKREPVANTDMAEFLNEIEEDPEMRANINLYKVSAPPLTPVGLRCDRAAGEADGRSEPRR